MTQKVPKLKGSTAGPINLKTLKSPLSKASTVASSTSCNDFPFWDKTYNKFLVLKKIKLPSQHMRRI